MQVRPRPHDQFMYPCPFNNVAINLLATLSQRCWYVALQLGKSLGGYRCCNVDTTLLQNDCHETCLQRFHYIVDGLYFSCKLTLEEHRCSNVDTTLIEAFG